MNLDDVNQTVAHRHEMVHLAEQHEHIASVWRLRIAKIDQLVNTIEELENTIASREKAIASMTQRLLKREVSI